MPKNSLYFPRLTASLAARLPITPVPVADAERALRSLSERHAFIVLKPLPKAGI